MAQKFSGLRCFSAEWTYNGGDVTIVVPDGWRVVEVILDITATYDGTALVIGYTGDTDAFIKQADHGGVIGIYRMTSDGSGAKKDGYTLGASEDVILDLTVGGGNSTGAGVVYVYASAAVA